MTDGTNATAADVEDALRNGVVVRVSVCRELVGVGLDDGRTLILPMGEERTAMLWDAVLTALRRTEADKAGEAS